MLTAINESNNMIAVPGFTRPDSATCKMAAAIVAIKDPNAHARRDC
jgi:hypothetical protein